MRVHATRAIVEKTSIALAAAVLGLMAGFFWTYSYNVNLAMLQVDGATYATVQSLFNVNVRHAAFFMLFFGGGLEHPPRLLALLQRGDSDDAIMHGGEVVPGLNGEYMGAAQAAYGGAGGAATNVFNFQGYNIDELEQAVGRVLTMSVRSPSAATTP